MTTAGSKIDRGKIHHDDVDQQRTEQHVVDCLRDMGVPHEDVDEAALPPGFRGIIQSLSQAGVPPVGWEIRVSELAALADRRPWMIEHSRRWWLKEYPQGEGWFMDNLVKVYAMRSLLLDDRQASELQSRLRRE